MNRELGRRNGWFGTAVGMGLLSLAPLAIADPPVPDGVAPAVAETPVVEATPAVVAETPPTQVTPAVVVETPVTAVTPPAAEAPVAVEAAGVTATANIPAATESSTVPEPPVSGVVEPAAAPTKVSPAPVNEPWRELTPDQWASAKHALVTSLSQLDQFLARGAEANRQAWREYLGWKALEEQLAAERPDLAVLSESLTKLLSGEPGLELPPFVGLRNATMRWRRMALATDDKEIQQRLNEHFAAVRDAVDQATTLNEQQLQDVANRLEWLEQLGQAPQLVAEARDRLGRPNLWISASSQTVARGFSEPVYQTTPLNEMLLGTHLCGTATTQGTVTAQLVPSSSSAVIDLCMSGVTHSNTVGTQSPVTIYGHGITNVLARKRLVIDPTGVRADPACAQCSTHSTINSISAGDRLGAKLIERIAWKKAGQQKWQAEQISSRRAEARIAQRMDEQTLQRIGTTNYRWEHELREPARKRGNYPRALGIWSTSDRLHVVATQGQPQQLTAVSSPPAAPDHPLLVQVHQSLIGNSAVNSIGGMTITDERAQELIKEITGNVPEEMKLKQDEDPWSITFDLQQPVSVVFHDNQVRIAIRGRKFVRGDQVVKQTIQIAANYGLEIVNGRVNLRRQGDVDVTYPENKSDRLSMTDLSHKTFLTKKFSGLFKEELNGEGLKLPNQWAKLKELALGYAAADNGWLSLGWK